MRFEWSEGLSTGVEAIDKVYRELFTRFNRLIQACDQGSGRDEAVKMIDFLNVHMLEHFRIEEDLQQKYGYPDIECHRKEHLSLLLELDHLQQQLAEMGPIPKLVALTNQMVAVWLIDHISRQDADFARFLSIARR